jgi:hypothetical protein
MIRKKDEHSEEQWPVIDGPERAKEAAQLRLVVGLMQKALTPPLPNHVNYDLVHLFFRVCELSSVCDQIIYDDSTYRMIDGERLPQIMPIELVLENLKEQEMLKPTHMIVGVEDIPGIVKELESIEINGVDEHLMLMLDDASENVLNRKETLERCAIQLEETDDSVQRAMIFLEMGQDDDALREFQKITPDEILNPDNALDLVELTEKFQTKIAALRVLKRWFVLGIVLHPLTFDLLADILFPGLLLSSSIRIDHLRGILNRCEIDSIETIRRNMILALPAQTNFIIDKAEVEQRLKLMGTNLRELNLSFEESEELCLYTLLTDLCAQLNRLASLAKDTNNRKLALNAVERCILASLILFFLPPRQQDIQKVIGYGSYNICHEWIIENLLELLTIYEDILPQNHSERTLSSRLQFQFESVRALADKIAKHHTIEAESQK